MPGKYIEIQIVNLIKMKSKSNLSCKTHYMCFLLKVAKINLKFYFINNQIKRRFVYLFELGRNSHKFCFIP